MEIEFPYSAKELLCAGVLPAAIGLSCTLLAARFLKRDAAVCWLTGTGVGLAALLGSRLSALPGWFPKSHWHWMPWVAAGFGLMAPACLHGRSWVRCVTLTCLAILAAWVLVPSWDNLPMSRPLLVTMAAMTICGFADFSWTQSVSDRTPPWINAVIVLFACLVCNIVLSCAGSLRLSLVGMSVSGGLIGSAQGVLLSRRTSLFACVFLLAGALLTALMWMRGLNSATGLPVWCLVGVPVLLHLYHWTQSAVRPSAASRWCSLAFVFIMAAGIAGLAVAEILRSSAGE